MYKRILVTLDQSDLAERALTHAVDMAQAMELFGRMMEAAQKLDEEVKKMSDAERKEFEQRWAKKFEEAGLDRPGD